MGAVLILGYLFSFQPKSKALVYLTWVFVSLAGLYLLAAYQSSSVAFNPIFNVTKRIQLFFPALASFFFLKFGIHFPRIVPELKDWNRSINIIGVSSLIAVLGILGRSFWKLEDSDVSLLFPIVSVILFSVVLFFVFLTRKVFFFKHQNNERNVKSILILFSSFIFVFFVIFTEIIYSFQMISEFIESPFLSASFQCFQFYLAYIFINQSHIKTTVVMRILGLAFFTFLLILGNSGHYLMNILREDYQKPIPISPLTTIRFTPTMQKGYKIENSEYKHSESSGYCFETTGDKSVSFEIPFSFPFYGKIQNRVQVFSQPNLYFAVDSLRYRHDLALYYPGMLPLAIHSASLLDNDEFICVEMLNSEFRVSWENLRLKDEPDKEAGYSVQVTLYPDGSFLWSYKKLYPLQRLYGHNWSTSLDLVGLFPGKLDSGNGDFPWQNLGRGIEIGEKAVSLNLQKRYLSYIHQRMISLFWVMLVLYFLSFLVYPFYLKRTLVLPLLEIVQSIERIANGYFDRRITMKYNDEIGFISVSFNVMQHKLREAAEFQLEKNRILNENLNLVKTENIELEVQVEETNEQLRKRNFILEKDMRMARKIQEKILPNFDSLSYLSSFYQPMDAVGGDLFDKVNFRDSNKMGIFLCDVSGHGLAAAFITSMIKVSILQSGEIKEKPNELLAYLNQALYEQNAGHFATAFYAIYYKDTKVLEYSNAGHLPPFIFDSESLTELKSGLSPAVGMFSNAELKEKGILFANENLTLGKNQKVFFYTDGITEVSSPNDEFEFFPEDKIKKLLVGNANSELQPILNGIYNNLVNFHGSREFRDDLCMILFDPEKVNIV